MVDATDMLARDDGPVDNFAEQAAENGPDILEIELEPVGDGKSSELTE